VQHEAIVVGEDVGDGEVEEALKTPVEVVRLAAQPGMVGTDSGAETRRLLDHEIVPAVPDARVVVGDIRAPGGEPGAPAEVPDDHASRLGMAGRLAEQAGDRGRPAGIGGSKTDGEAAQIDRRLLHGTKLFAAVPIR
jgi:hypothetical protein